MKKFEANYLKEKFRAGLILYKKYSRKDVCRILNWEKDESATIYGYRIKHGSCPIFVTYHKDHDISESTKYEDVFINTQTFSWMTRSRLTKKSIEVIQIEKYLEIGLRIPLFIKKNNDEGTDFYYMGDLNPLNSTETTIAGNDNRTLPIVNIIYHLVDEVEESIYQYFEGEI